MNTYLLKDDQQCGPYDDVQIRAYLRDGTCSYEDMAWREGLPDWQPLRTFYTPPIHPPAAPVLPSKPQLPAQQKSPFASPIVKYGGCFILLCIALPIVGIISHLVSQSTTPKAGSAPAQPKQPSLAERIFSNPEERAKNCAKTLVLKNIKAPSTATFAETRILYKEHPWYQVFVLVDAQNSFGAYIRGSFVCTLELGEGDKFSYKPAFGIQEMNEGMIKLGGVLESIRAMNNWPGANKDESK